MNLSDVYVFKKVAATLSFTKAARQIGISRSAVSKQVSRLEQSLGVLLLNRTTRSVNLTEAGRTFDSQTARIDSTIERAADLVRGADLSPLGTVSFSLPSGLGAGLMPVLATKFRKRWPELHLNIHFVDQAQDLIANNLDLAIRISKKLSDSSLIARRLSSTRRVLAASPKYWRANGYPRSPRQLVSHRCLGLGSATHRGTTWTITDSNEIIDVPIEFAFSTNNNLALILAACLDGGIVFLPEICISGELARNRLESIPHWTDPDEYGVYALYPHRKAATKVKILVDFIEHWLPEIASFDRWAPLEEPCGGDADRKDGIATDGVEANVA